jgi:ketosteroid isomerase-like protein
METPQAFLERYARNTDAHDLGATLGMVADDAIYLFSDGAAHVGKPAIAKVLTANFAAIVDETYRIRDVRWLLSTADAAACVYIFDWSGLVAGKLASGHGRGTSVLHRTADGWRVVHEHLSRGGLD